MSIGERPLLSAGTFRGAALLQVQILTPGEKLVCDGGTLRM
jgi:hypothetical protein